MNADAMNADMNPDQTSSNPRYDPPFHPGNAFVMGAVSNLLLNAHVHSGTTSEASAARSMRPLLQHTLHHGLKGGVALASAALIGNALGRGHYTSGIVSFAGGLLTMTLLDNLLSSNPENNKPSK